MAASRHTRKRTNASVKAKKFPPPVATKSVIDEVAISKNGIKVNEEKRDGMPSCEEVLELKHHGNDQPNGNALENRSIPLIHANGAAKNVNANSPLSPPKSLKVPLSYTNNIQPSPQQAANEWTRQQQQQQYHAPSSVAGVFPPSFQQQQQQQQQQMMQMMMSSGMMDPSSAAAMFMQYNNYGGPGGGRGVPSANHQQNLLLMGNPIHDFLQMQQNPTAFPTRYLINAQNGPFPFPWPPVGMPPFPTIPAGMSARHQIENAAGTTTATQRATKPGEGDHGQQNIDKNDKNEDITNDENNAAGAAKVTTTELEKDQQQNEKETTTQLVENGSGMSSDNFQTTTTTANNTFGSVSNGKKTVTRVLPTEEQLEHRQRYLQQQQQLNQFNAFNALQQSGAAYSAYAAALSMGQPDIDPPSFAAQRAFQQHQQQQQQHFHNMMNNNFNSNQHHHQQQMYLHHHQQQQQTQQQQQQQQHEYQQQPSLQPTTTTTQKKGKQGVSKSNRNRLVWNDELHKRFMNAVNHLGLDAAVPKTIMQMMNVEGLTRENVASHLQKYRLKQMTAEEKAAMNANIAMKKNASLSTMDGSNYTGDGKELLNGNAPNRKGASLKRPAGTETETLEGTKKSKMQNEGDANVATAPIEVNATPTANPIGGTSAAAQDGKDSGESSDERDNNSGGENNFQNPPQHESDPKENEQQQQELHKKQQRSKRGKSSSDDEASDKDNFGQQHRVVVGS